MSAHTSEAEWRGDLHSGSGDMTVGDGVWEGAYTFKSRFEGGEGGSPEEFAAVAHASCYSMALSHILSMNGHVPTRVHSKATLYVEPLEEGGVWIPKIDLVMEAEVPGCDEATFMTHAEEAKVGCPISRLFTGAEINLSATLLG